MTFFGRDPVQRVQGLRIEEESRRRDEETKNRLAHSQHLDVRQRSRLGDLVAKIRRAVGR